MTHAMVGPQHGEREHPLTTATFAGLLIANNAPPPR